MVVSHHRESSISSNIRAIIEQLNLNPVERRRLIESRSDEPRCKSHVVDASTKPRVTIGVYGQIQQQEYIKKFVEEKSIDNYSSVVVVQQQEPEVEQQVILQQPRPRKIARKIEPRPRQRIPPRLELEEILKKDAAAAPTTPTNNNSVELLPPPSPLKEDLPEPTNGNLNHDAALHRISVRPKNRRPPRRATPTSSNNSSLNTSNGNLNSTTSTNGLPRIDSISEISIDTLDSLEGTLPPAESVVDTPTTPLETSSPVVVSKPIPILRKSSSRLSRNSEVFEELEAKLRKPAVSPDSLDSNLDSRSSADVLEDGVKSIPPPKPSPRTASVSSDDRVMSPITASSPSDRRRRISSNRLSKSPDSLEGISPGWFTKSNEGFDKLLSADFDNHRNSNTNLNHRDSNSSLANLNAIRNSNTNLVNVNHDSNTNLNRDSSTNLVSVNRDSNTNLVSVNRDSSTNLVSFHRDSSTNLVSVNRDSNTNLANGNRDSNTNLANGNRDSNTNIVNPSRDSNVNLSNTNLSQKPIAAARKLLLKPISKSQERVCCTKSSDSLEALEALNSDNSMERRRSSFEIRNRRIMSKSTECFDSGLIEHRQQLIAAKAEEKRKRASVSEMNLSRGGSAGNRNSKLLSKSSESFEAISSLVETQLEKSVPVETEKPQNMWRAKRRITNSSESSDNLDLEDNCKLENRSKARRTTPKRLSSGSGNINFMDEQDTVLTRKPPSRLQKSSESSELGSTDTLDSERRNTMKSSDSDETLDSLEKDLQESQTEQDKQDEEALESVLDRREKSEEEEQQQQQAPQPQEKVSSYWRRRTNSQESTKDSNNLDIQLLAYTLVSKIQENGNSNDDHNDKNHEENKIMSPSSPVVVYPKKKQHHQQSSSSEDNKTLSSTFNNLLSSKNDEDLQNMLNGNISEVSTESTKSFKEKLIMFEKLGK